MRCYNNTKCIPLSKHCNGHIDCLHKDDELACGATCPTSCRSCSGLEFACENTDWNSLKHEIHSSARVIHITHSIANISTTSFSEFRLLIVLNLSSNDIANIRQGSFASQHNLLKLDLSQNSIAILHNGTFKGLKNTRNVFLRYNLINTIHEGAFEDLINVTELDLSEMYIHTMIGKAFEGLGKLSLLNLSNNAIGSVSLDTFYGLMSLQKLDISRNRIFVFSKSMFQPLSSLEVLVSDHYKFCCLANQVSEELCSPRPNAFSSCTAMMKTTVLRLSLWVIGLLAMLGNASVIIVRILGIRLKKSTIPDLLITCLASSDFMMGTCMIILAAVDAKYRDNYIANDEQRRSSGLCNFCGFLATLSSEVSAFMLLILTFDRFLSIGFPLKNWRLRVKTCKIVLCVAWGLGAVIAGMPLLPIPYFGGVFYARSPTCISLHISSETYPGWEYSFGIFTVFNFCIFIAVGVMYFWMYMKIKQTGKMFKGRRKNMELTVARKMAAVIVTDLLCWIPVSILG